MENNTKDNIEKKINDAATDSYTKAAKGFSKSFKEGDVDAFKQFYEYTKERLKEKARNAGIPKSEIDGFLYEAYIDLYNRRASFNPDKVTLSEWFDRVTDKSIKRFKKKLIKRAAEHIEEYDIYADLETDEDNDLFAEIEYYINEPEKKGFAALAFVFSDKGFKYVVGVCVIAVVFIGVMAVISSFDSSSGNMVLKSNSESVVDEDSEDDTDATTTEDDGSSSVLSDTADDVDETDPETDSGSDSVLSDDYTDLESAEEEEETTTSTQTNTESSHTHNWVAQYTTVYHDAVTEKVQTGTTTEVVADEYEEYVYEEKYMCQGCEYFFETADENHLQTCSGSGYDVINVLVDIIYHEKVTEEVPVEETVTIQEAYSERVITGYKCSSCGETRE